MEEQKTLMNINLCNSCNNYPCPHLVEQKRKYGNDVFVKKCNGYSRKVLR